MVHPNVTRFHRELQVFLKEYLSIKNNNFKLLRFDFFPQGSQTWHLGILAELEGKQCLMNPQGDILCRYDEIIPLFCLPEDPKLRATLEDLQDQLLCLRSKAPQEPLLALTHSLQTLCAPFRSLSPAYLVREQGLYGIVDPLGAQIVAPRYRSIEPFPFREKFGDRNECSSPVPGGLYGETGLYLCRGDLHRLNSTDVYDLKGNLIFRDIADLYPRQELWVTPKRNAQSTAMLRQEKQIRSIWVSRQEAEQPFPDAPELQGILDRSTSYSVRALSKPVQDGELRCHEVDNALPWAWDTGSILADKAFKKSPQVFRTLLMPLAAQISRQIGFTPEAVLDRLGDYGDFTRERTQVSLEGVTPETELQALGLTDQAYNCLVRSGITTTAELLARSEDRLAYLRRSTPQVLQEITELHTRLQKYL